MQHHAINYVEFAGKDLEKIKQFYIEVFGWTFTDYGPSYAAFGNSYLEGGFSTEAMPGKGPLVILYSNNLAATKDSILAHGGHLEKDIYSFPGGRRFHFIDPGGNELAVWSDY